MPKKKPKTKKGRQVDEGVMLGFNARKLSGPLYTRKVSKKETERHRIAWWEKED